MTRILHILDHSLPAHSGYSFRTRALMKAQLAKGWDVAGITGVRHPLPGTRAEEVDGLRFFRTPAIADAPSPLREWREVQAFAAAIEALVDEFRPDILHAHSPVLCAMAAGRVARRRQLPWIYEIRAFWEDAAVGNGTGREGNARYVMTRMLETRAVRMADAVAVICAGLRDDLVARGIAPEKIIISPNGVDLDMFGAPVPRNRVLARRLGLEGADVMGFIGSFYDYEGLDDLIAAMPAIVNRAPAAQLLLVGGGPQEAALKAQAERSPVASRIRFIGRVPHAEVEHYYSLVDLLVYPRKKMRLTDLVTPLKPLEAMAQHKLVAASDVGGHRELIENGRTGLLFPADDPHALAVSVSDLLNDRSRWGTLLADAYDYVVNHRNWSSNILRYDPVYQQLLDRKKQSRAA